jgi:hypothetical protein
MSVWRLAVTTECIFKVAQSVAKTGLITVWAAAAALLAALA